MWKRLILRYDNNVLVLGEIRWEEEEKLESGDFNIAYKEKKKETGVGLQYRKVVDKNVIKR